MRPSVDQLLQELGIERAALRRRGLHRYREASRLVPVGLGTDGRDKLLTPQAAQAWLSMRDAAARSGVSLLLVSAFRSAEYQASLLRARLAKGETIEVALTINAPPGYSEHHTGRAIDIGTPGCGGLDEAFENTAAYAWLEREASSFGFTMSYPRDNPQGYRYEPWHWCHS
ncbi:MAG: D-alanyl-D-alanine carboxypeptidase family protein [Hydrocarboniphaga sp.]|uniref:M15 family metallopeptidase n=1 Tax=Hydrocarboniphaga sp. TaxID=2033016 RepID=UPI002613ACC3|nr:M15 family metallopeptidase [Hydrocarboniphaga sp.]MDB5972908.1 D-alanyl-D-alanine carboxypeptidase family protein [Hydrocarboniphaga sp.]